MTPYEIIPYQGTGRYGTNIFRTGQANWVPVPFSFIQDRQVRGVRCSHGFVSWAAGAFGDGPADVVEGTLPLAGFAVQTVGGVGRVNLIMNRFIYARRAERNTGAVKFRCALGPANVAVDNRQM